MKCLVCQTELVCKYYKGRTVSGKKETAIYECPKCGHKDDEGCAVIAALNNADIQQSRYNNFMFLNGAVN